MEKTGYRVNGSDSAYFVRNINGKLKAQEDIHVDDLIIAGDNRELIEKIKTELEISHMEKNKFRFTGLDITGGTNGNISVSMEAYTDTIVEIPTFRKEVGSTSLNKAETSVYLGYIRKFMWLT